MGLYGFYLDDTQSLSLDIFGDYRRGAYSEGRVRGLIKRYIIFIFQFFIFWWSYNTFIIACFCWIMKSYTFLQWRLFCSNGKGTEISKYQKIASFGIIWHTNDSVIVQSRLSGIIRAGSPLQRALWRQLRWNECITRTSTVSGPDQQSGKVGLELPDCWTDIAANAYHWHVNFLCTWICVFLSLSICL